MRPPCFRDSGKYSRLAMYQGVGSQATRFPVSSFSQLLPKKSKKALPRELSGVSEDSPSLGSRSKVGWTMCSCSGRAPCRLCVSKSALGLPPHQLRSPSQARHLMPRLGMPASLVCLVMCKMSSVHCSPGEYRDGGHEGNLAMSRKSDLGPRKQQVTWECANPDKERPVSHSAI